MITATQMRDELENDYKQARSDFLLKHSSHTKRIATDLWKFYEAFERALSNWPRTRRAQTVGTFLHAAGNSLVQSTNLLVAGMIAPSGNLMRQHAEGIAMALLCVPPEHDTLSRYLADRKRFPVHDSLGLLQRKRIADELAALLGFDAAGWRVFCGQMKFFNQHSHSSVVALAGHMRFGTKAGAVIIGSAYDPLKFAIYRKELRFRQGAAKRLRELLRRIDRAMPLVDQK